MILYPAIDLKGGQCVRLLRGDMDKATVFNTDPAAQARAFVQQGAEWIHVVDLDGAIAGYSANEDAIRQIRNAVDIPIQLGGGIRTRESIERWLTEVKVDRVILGTVAMQNPEFAKEACARFRGAVAIGIDARDGKVAIKGWTEQSQMNAIELASQFQYLAAAIIYTDIDRDGMLQGVNVEATARLAKAVDTQVIASGGISSLDDIRALKKHSGINGAILGRALYERKFTLAEALAAAKPDDV